MLFESAIDEGYTPTDWDSIQECKYDLGIEGAYMHMYENQCNFNAMMKAVGLSELSYYKRNPCLKCRKGGGCYDHGCFMPEDWGDFLTSKSCGVSIRLQDIQEVQVKDLF